MAKDMWENEISKRQETYKEGIKRDSDECDEARNHPTYLKCREGWRKFRKGEITAEQLGEYTGGNEDTGAEALEDMFGGKEC